MNWVEILSWRRELKTFMDGSTDKKSK